ncbi:MAG: carboxy-S-adenosyl-L-methionine synthase CmoA [Planctomycetota bacterium]
MRDEIYSLPRDQVGKFEFDDAVADVFPDMINRSVPGYGSILSVIEQLSERFVTPGSNVYDLGCSLGAATLLIRGNVPRDVTIHAIDSSEAMTRRLAQRLAATPGGSANVEVRQADVLDITMDNASLVVLNFTLQFIPAEQRDALLSRVCNSLQPGGALLLSEKVCFDAPAQQKLLTDLHLDFKRANGYSELEIAQKRTSLENTLIPETIEAHCDRLRKVGFGVVAPWFLCFNFASILAVKGDS